MQPPARAGLRSPQTAAFPQSPTHTRTQTASSLDPLAAHCSAPIKVLLSASIVRSLSFPREHLHLSCSPVFPRSLRALRCGGVTGSCFSFCMALFGRTAWFFFSSLGGGGPLGACMSRRCRSVALRCVAACFPPACRFLLHYLSTFSGSLF